MISHQEIISIEKCKEWLDDFYGISGEINFLYGEKDLNFQVEVNGDDIYLLKIGKQPDLEILDFQSYLFEKLSPHSSKVNIQKLHWSKNGNSYEIVELDDENSLSIRLFEWIPGRLWSSVNPITEDLRKQLGEHAGELCSLMSALDHPKAQRKSKWDNAQLEWIENHLELFPEDRKPIILSFLNRFKEGFASYNELPKQIVHNDINDNNIIVTEDLINPKITGIIDFGDAIYTQRINDLAICVCYAIMGTANPLEAALPIVGSYNFKVKLLEEELMHLYNCIGMRLLISVTNSAINKIERPDNEYLQISDASAWELLERWKNINPEFAHYSFRNTCGLSAHPSEGKFKQWAKEQSLQILDLFPHFTHNELYLLDLSISSKWIGHQKEFNNLDLFQYKIDQIHKAHPMAVIAGGYLEPRPIYTSDTYGRIGNNGPESRSIHLGIDFWFDAGTAVHSLFDAEVIAAVNDAGEKEYGGMVILKHKENDLEFFTLYGHLSVSSALKHSKGDKLMKGDKIGELGDYPENGNWAPHLHFQIMLNLLDYEIDFPGVAYPNEIDIWTSLCPDPNLLFKIEGLKTRDFNERDKIIETRNNYLGKSLSLHYESPLHIVRGMDSYLFDPFGRKYLDTVNNVAHVGHENFKVITAAKDQLSLLNTNTRYLHSEITELSKKLLSKLPESLKVIHFVNSGSEANDLALRMAKTYTNSEQIITSQYGYHGHTEALIDVSSYKFDGKGGKGKPENTHIIPCPDTFRGKYQGEHSAEKYIDELKTILDDLSLNSLKPAALIIESIISCGGQIVLPDGFLKEAFELIRNEGGVCIADEVQTGLGRVGKTYWAFELHDVVPDIVTIGKPFGNGHPVAAIVCTQAIAEAFNNGMEYFNTFGGNPVSSAVAKEVLTIIDEEELQSHALEIGNYLKKSLEDLAIEFPIIGDVRGEGLFLGFELVDAQKKPLTVHAKYLVNRMKDRGILMSSDGPDNNVIKLKPPLTFNKSHADQLLINLRIILSEDFMKHF